MTTTGFAIDREPGALPLLVRDRKPGGAEVSRFSTGSLECGTGLSVNAGTANSTSNRGKKPRAPTTINPIAGPATFFSIAARAGSTAGCKGAGGAFGAADVVASTFGSVAPHDAS